MIVERVRRALEKRARNMLKERWQKEGLVLEFRIGRGRRFVWNDGLTVEVSGQDGTVYGKYRIIVSVSLRAVRPTPKISSIPKDTPFDSDRIRQLLENGAEDAAEGARRKRKDFGR